MRKLIDIICFICWSIALIFGIMALFGLIEVSPFGYVCAIVVCIGLYGERVFMPSIENQIAYICDETECESCQKAHPSRYCWHTTDVKHAKNFEEVSPGIFIEKE